MTVVALSGLLGLGKSSVTEGLKADLKLFEPVEDNVYLNDYYAAPKDYALRMQLNLLIKRFESAQVAHWHSSRGDVVIQDRTICEDFEFLVCQKRAGYIDDRDFHLYREYHNVMCGMIPMPDLVIWLECENAVDLSMQRIALRNRSCEAGVPREYLESLNRSYHELMPLLGKKCPVVTVDPNQPFEDVLSQCQALVDAKHKELRDCNDNPIYHGGF